MRARRIRRGVAAVTLAATAWCWLQTYLMGGGASPPSASQTDATPANGRSRGAKTKVRGRALDSNGRPIAGAMVLLTRQVDADLEFAEPAVIAQTQSRADGQFEFAPLDSDLKNADQDLAPFCEIWIWKSGLAVARSSFFDRLPEQPFVASLDRESGNLSFRLQNLDGSSCASATVTPSVWRANTRFCVAIPKPLQDRLRVHSGPDGRVEIAGFHGELFGVAVEKAGAGVQSLVLAGDESSGVTYKIFETTTLEGQVTLPHGETVDLSRVSVILEASSNGEKRWDGSMPAPGTWIQQFEVPADRNGRFTIPHFFRHGRVGLRVKVPDDIPFDQGIAFDGFASPSFDPKDNKLKIRIPLQRGIWATRLVRDSQTKRPLAGIDVFMVPKTQTTGLFQVCPTAERSDENGCIRVFVLPGATYCTHCELPEGYLRLQAGSEADVLIPSGADRYELPPIEVVRSATVEGSVLDVAGQPLSCVRVCARSRPVGTKTGNDTDDVCRWATTDSRGHFRLDQIEAGTNVTLLPVRAGIALTDSIQIAAGDEKPVRFQETKRELVALGGRVLGTDHKPIDGARVVVEVHDSPDPIGEFRIAVDSQGSFRTPALFPKDMKYRLTVRSMLDVVASSDWMCPAASADTFPDLIVDRAKAAVTSKLSGKETVARVNGQPIFASELLERAFVEQLTDGSSLLSASTDLAAGRMTEAEYRSLQETAIKTYLNAFVRTRLLTQAFLAKLDADQKKALEEAFAKKFDKYVERLKGDFKVATRDEVDRRMHKQGTSLASLQAEYRYQLLSDEYLRANPPDSDLVRRKSLEYYLAHRDAYATRPKVYWQLLEINFYDPTTDPGKTIASSSSLFLDDTHVNDSDKQNAGAGTPGVESDKSRSPGGSGTKAAHESGEYIGKKKAHQIIDEAVSRLSKSEVFEDVVTKFSNGPRAEQGGWQPPTSPESVVEEKTADALRGLAEGKTSSVIETDHSLRIVRVVSRIPAGCKPFEEVAESICQLIKRDLKQKALEEVYSRACIEFAFVTDTSCVRPSSRAATSPFFDYQLSK